MRRRNASALPGPQPLGILQSKTHKRFPTHLWLYSLLLAAFFLLFATGLRADTITGTVKDPSGAVVAGARIEITGTNLPQPIVVESDATGLFSVPNLTAGKYSVHVTKSGFDELVAPVDLDGTAEVTLKLTIAAQQTEINVTDSSPAFANSDAVYHSLRDIGTGDSFHCENFKITLDVGTFEFRSGTITLLSPINKAETGLIFVGAGHFSLKPVVGIDTRELTRRAGAATAEEEFAELVLRFSPEQYQQFVSAQGAKTATPPEATAALQHWKDKVRHRHEFPEGFTQAILENETIDNVDADVLAAVYNPQHPPFLTAYMHGTPHKDLRFFIRARVGAIPQLDSPEEVALINCNGAALDDGIWYSQHLLTEFQNHTAGSSQEKRLFVAKRYNIETAIAKNDHMFGRATVTFEPLIAGERVLKFGLLPTLRVTRVTGENGQDLHFIQENRKQDGSFYAILDHAPELKKDHSVNIEYAGDKVLYDAGDGSYYVGARESWYPNLNGGFGGKAFYDLTFKVPHSNIVISVGKLEKQYTDEGFAAFHWVTPIPVAIAGFNYGRYQKLDYPDTITHYDISGYYLTELPNSLKPFANTALRGMSPISMTKYTLDQTRAQMQLCTFYFGKAPYDNIYITEQPNFNFGQSWPNLVYLPISAYIDSTQRWMLFGTINTKFNGFVQEVTPHEVAHQWFGHGVGWASYHDQWLSEGFAEFAAGLFLQEAVGPKWQKDYLEFWERQRVRILEKNNFGISPNDAGPLWLGLRLISPRSPGAYQGVTYSKGAYVLLMLKSLMRDDQAEKDRDQSFIEMMHDFMQTYHDTSASTEGFKAVAEKHMTKQMDLQKNGRLDWFFREWVYDTQVPRYSFKYTVESAPTAGKFKVHAELTQSEVDNQFAMFVPVYADFGNGMVRFTQMAVVGNSTRSMDFILDRQPKKVAINTYKEILER
jgi:hypothetical protein